MGRRLVRKDRYIFFLLKQPILSFWTMSSKNHQKIWPSSTLMNRYLNFWHLKLVQKRFNCCVLAAVIQLSTCLVKNLSITMVLVMKSMVFFNSLQTFCSTNVWIDLSCHWYRMILLYFMSGYKLSIIIALS
jgi:hypothetical protein